MNNISAFLDFMNRSPSAYHAAANLADMLRVQGYTQIFEQDNWNLQPGGKYFLVRDGISTIAFRIPETAPTGFLMSAAHVDRPGFKLKEGELKGAYTRLSTEGYGGMIMSTWADRPLSVAGRVLVETEDGISARLIDIDRDLLLIPNVAIHMNRQVNDGFKWNLAVDTIPLLGSKEAEGKFQKLLDEAAGGKILGGDLYLYLRQKASLWGVEEEFVSAQGLDDLECVWGCAQGFLQAEKSDAVSVLCAFDSEEVGSNSPQGAASTLLSDTLTRICDALQLDLRRMLAQSFMVSADNAHGLHPNHPEHSDAANAPVLGGGVVLKFNANQRYATSGVSAAVFRKVCAKAEVPVQTYYNRADIPGGSTLGHISLTQVSVPTADVGLAQLAMHSCYETAAVKDLSYLEKAMTAYYSMTLEAAGDGNWQMK